MMRPIAICMMLVLTMSSPVWAQGAQPVPGTDPHHPAPAPGQRPGGTSSGGMPMKGMMCPMMGGMMGGGIMSGGMMGGMMPMPGAGGPAESPRMLQMRGEMLKAMGDILMKYGKMMEGGTRP